MKNIILENALKEDAKYILEINSKTWFDTYKRDIITKELDNKYKSTKEQKDIFLNKKALDIEQNPWSYIIAKHLWKVIWYACWKKHIDKQYNELFSIYILSNYQWIWVWKLLINQVFYHLWTEKDIIVKVVSYNKKAISFYEKLWFEFKEDLDDFEILPWVFVWEKMFIKKVNTLK